MTEARKTLDKAVKLAKKQHAGATLPELLVKSVEAHMYITGSQEFFHRLHPDFETYRYAPPQAPPKVIYGEIPSTSFRKHLQFSKDRKKKSDGWPMCFEELEELVRKVAEDKSDNNGNEFSANYVGPELDIIGMSTGARVLLLSRKNERLPVIEPRLLRIVSGLGDVSTTVAGDSEVDSQKPEHPIVTDDAVRYDTKSVLVWDEQQPLEDIARAEMHLKKRTTLRSGWLWHNVLAELQDPRKKKEPHALMAEWLKKEWFELYLE